MSFTAGRTASVRYSIYIRFSRGEKYSWLGEDARLFQRTILTAVVAAELYAGTAANRKSERWMNFVRPTVPWAISLSPPGLCLD